MKEAIETKAGTVAPGMKIRIVSIYDSRGDDFRLKDYAGKTGKVTLIDDAGQIHGTWGGLAVIPEVDEFIII